MGKTESISMHQNIILSFSYLGMMSMFVECVHVTGLIFQSIGYAWQFCTIIKENKVTNWKVKGD